MGKLISAVYGALFVRVFFYKFNKLLYGLSLRGMGMLNFETHHPSDEDHFISNEISNIGEGIIFDVGANNGLYSKKLRNDHPHVRIYAFEPHPKTYQNLVKNLDGLNINTLNVGVGSANGVLKLYDYVDKDASEHASLYKSVIETIHKGEAIEHEVNMITLDDLAKEEKINRVGLLKIDTEGHELEVLKGFEWFIRRNRIDMIHFEFNEMNVISRVFFKDFWDFLPNYDFYRMLPDGLIPIKYYSPILCEIFAYQNIVAKLKSEFRNGV